MVRLTFRSHQLNRKPLITTSAHARNLTYGNTGTTSMTCGNACIAVNNIPSERPATQLDICESMVSTRLHLESVTILNGFPNQQIQYVPTSCVISKWSNQQSKKVSVLHASRSTYPLIFDLLRTTNQCSQLLVIGRIMNTRYNQRHWEWRKS